MKYHVPFSSSYVTIRKFEKVASILLYISAALVGLIWLESKLNIKTTLDYTPNPYIEITTSLSYASMIGYLFFSIIIRFLFHSAERMKCNDLIDNSFGTDYSNQKSYGYYTNDELPPGLKKLTLNSYESCFHTKHTLKKMLYKSSLKLLFFGVPFLLSIFSSGGYEIIRLLFEISIPFVLFYRLIIEIGFYIGITRLNERFKIELLNKTDDPLSLKDSARLLIPVFDYYNLKSWASINLDERIFKKYKDEISNQWSDRKNKLLL